MQQTGKEINFTRKGIMDNKFKGNIRYMRSLDSNGFTLIEVMISMVVLVVGMIAVMSLVSIVMKGNLSSNRMTTATTIAQDKMEELIAMDIDDILIDSGTDTTHNIDYYWYSDVTPNTIATDTKTVSVEVYWSPPGSSSANSVQVQTFISE